MDRVEQLHRFGRLVRLEPADAVEADVGMAGEQRRPFGERFLHPVLAEVALAGVDQRLDLLGRRPLLTAISWTSRGIALGERGGRGDAVEDLLTSVGGAAHRGALKAGKDRHGSKSRASIHSRLGGFFHPCQPPSRPVGRPACAVPSHGSADAARDVHDARRSS